MARGLLAGLLSVFVSAFAAGQELARPNACDVVTKLQVLDGVASLFPLPDAWIIPPSATEVMTEIKHTLRALVAATLDASPEVGDHPNQLKALLEAEIADAGLPYGQEFGGHFGEIESIDCSRPATNPEVLAVTTRLWIDCGVDSSLYLFERRRCGWEPVLVAEVNGYQEIGDAQCWLAFGVSPPDSTGAFFAVLSDVNAHCMSNWQARRTRVLEPSGDPERPVEVLSRTDFVFLGDDEPLALTVTGDGFRFLCATEQWLDSGILVRHRVVAYGVMGAAAVRVPPFADEPTGFIDEWLSFPWDEAACWTRPGTRDEAKRWHRALGAGPRNQDTEVAFIQPCPEGEKWQVGVRVYAKLGPDRPFDPDGPSELVTFTVSREGDAFFIDGASTERPPGCPGEMSPYPER